MIFLIFIQLIIYVNINKHKHDGQQIIDLNIYFRTIFKSNT